MVALDAFLSRIRPEVPGCPEPTVERALRDRLVEFCQRSHAWQQHLGPLTAIAGRPEYTLTPPKGAQIEAVLSMTHVDTPLDPETEDGLDATRANWREERGRRARWWVMTAPSVFRLVPAPIETSARGIKAIRVALMPTRDADAVPDTLYDRYADGIAQGVLAHLLAMPRKQWSEPALAGHYHRLYEAAVSTALREKLSGFARPERDIPRRRLRGAP